MAGAQYSIAVNYRTIEISSFSLKCCNLVLPSPRGNRSPALKGGEQDLDYIQRRPRCQEEYSTFVRHQRKLRVALFGMSEVGLNLQGGVPGAQCRRRVPPVEQSGREERVRVAAATGALARAA